MIFLRVFAKASTSVSADYSAGGGEGQAGYLYLQVEFRAHPLYRSMAATSTAAVNVYMATEIIASGLASGRAVDYVAMYKTGAEMSATQQLHDLGQSLWLDNITRGLLTSGTLSRYIRELAVTGLTSNPTIFDHAIKNSDFYDVAIRNKALAGKSGETLFFELALEDLIRAADLFRPIHDATGGVDGWVSLEVSPLLADDTAGTIKAAAQLYARAQRPNFFIKIPGNLAGIPAIAETIFAGVPVNVTLLFSREHYLAAAEAYMRGIERRIAAGLDPRVDSVASIFVSRWDVAIKDKVPSALRNRLGIAIAMRTYKAYCELLAAPRWQKLAGAGARPQRLLWASTGTKDPGAPDTLYLEALAAPDTINTIPEKTLLAFVDHGKVKGVLPPDGSDAEAVLAEFARADVDDAALAATLQREGAQSFAKSWHDLMDCIASKSAVLSQTLQIEPSHDSRNAPQTLEVHSQHPGIAS